MWSGFVDFISSATPVDGTFSSEPDGRLEHIQLVSYVGKKALQLMNHFSS
jgi:hypothetical protein